VQLFDIGHTPVAVTQIGGRVPLGHPCQGLFPVEVLVAVVLGSHQDGGVVGDGAVAVVVKVVQAIVGIPAYVGKNLGSGPKFFCVPSWRP
jgi:hypothetical protein